MIIGNNNQNNSNKPNYFNERFNLIKEEGKRQQNINVINPKDTMKYHDVTNRNEMADKSLAMLQDRLNHGLISLEEFNQKARKINQLRQK